MDRRKFLKHTLEDRAELLWKNGEFISYRKYYNAKMALYQLNGYFVEVITREDSIESIEVQDDNQVLYLYAKDVDISNLIRF